MGAQSDFNQQTSGNTPEQEIQKASYGLELVLDLHGCDTSQFTRASIKEYCTELCDLIDMERCDLHFWDDVGVPEDEQQTDSKTKGTSAVQFILTSTIVIHTLDLMNTAYINIFSCKEFDTDKATQFTNEMVWLCGLDGKRSSSAIRGRCNKAWLM